MKRYIIYDPYSDSYVKIEPRGWTSGHSAEAVNSYGSLESARKDIAPLDSLKSCRIVEVEKTVRIVQTWEQ